MTVILGGGGGGSICIKTMDILFTEAWYSPKSKKLVSFLCIKNP